MKSTNQPSANLAGSVQAALLAIVTLMAATASSMAANVYWTGGVNGVWTNGGNWNTAADGSSGSPGAPSTTDTAFFTATSVSTAQIIALTNSLKVGGMVFNNANTTGLSNSLSAGLDCALTNGSGGLTVNSGAGAVSFLLGTKIIVPYLGANQIWANNSTNTLTIAKSLNLNGFALTLDCGGPITFLAANNITGAGGIIKQGANTLSIGSTPLFTGGLTVKAGMVTSSGSSAASIYGNGTVTLGDGGSGGGSATLQATTANAGIQNSITVASGSSGTLTIQASNSAAVTFGGAITLNSALTLDAPGTAAATFTNAITGSATLTKGPGTGTVTITKANDVSFTGNVNVNGGTLKINAGAGGALNSSSTLTFGSTGTFNYDNTNTTLTKAQSLGALTFAAGDGTVQITRTSLQTGLTFSSLAARTAGATRNFVYAGTPGTIGTDSTITLTGAAAGFLDQGSFVGGSAYAWMNGAGTYPRAMVYGSDAGAVTSGATTTLADATHQQITGAISGQNTATFTTLNISGNNSLTLASSQTVTVNGILKSGNVAGGATISGGTGIQADSGVEMVIRTDGVNDALTVSTPILANGASALTKSGAGTLTLSSAGNAYTGDTTVSAGTLKMSGSGTIASSGNIIISGGATLDVSTVTYTLGNSQTLKGPSAAATGIIKAGAGGLTLGSTTVISLPNYAPGTPALNVTGGALTLASGNPVTVTIKNGGVALAAGNYKLISKGTGGSVAGTTPTSVTVNGDGVGSGIVATLSIINGELYLVVAKTTTTTTVGSSVNPSTYGQAVTFTATVQTNGVTAAAATGNCVFKADGVVVGTSAAAGGVASLNTSALVAGALSITVEYAGDSNFFPSTNTSLSQVVNQAALVITANATNKVYDGVAFSGGNGVTYTGFVLGQTNTVLGGTLTYGGTSQGATNAGSYTIIPAGLANAVYTNYAISFASGTLTVSRAATSVGASSSMNPSGYKDSVTYTATLPAYASGSVVFSSTNGAFSTNAVTGVSTISLAITNLPRGTNVMTFAYLGDGNYLGSTNTLEQIVTNHPPVAGNNSYSRGVASDWHILVSELLTNATDLIDGDTLTLVSVGSSTNGITLDNDGTQVNYTNISLVGDQFTYTVTDSFGGINSGTITLTASNSVPGTSSFSGIIAGNPTTLTASGIAGYTYITQRATNLEQIVWEDIATNVLGTNVVISVTDSNPPSGSAFYRLKWNGN